VEICRGPIQYVRPVPRPSRKCLRVRLKATDEASLVEQFGGNLRDEAAFVPGLEGLSYAEPVRLELLYSGGALALGGDGEVVACGATGTAIALTWDVSCRPLLARVLERVRPDDALVPPRVVTEEIDVGQVLAEYALPLDDEPIGSAADEGDDDEALVVPIAEEEEPAPPTPMNLDLVSDLLDDPAFTAPPAAAPLDDEPLPLMSAVDMPAQIDEPLTPWAEPDPAPGEAPRREPGEVTPLARIELVRREPERIQTGDVEPMMGDSASDTAIPSKRSRTQLPTPGRRVVAIDVGAGVVRTAHFAMAPTVVATRRGLPNMPSAVVIEESGKTIVGEPALRKMFEQPGVRGTKRLIGRTSGCQLAKKLAPRLPYELVDGLDGEVAVRLGPHRIGLEEITALLLKEARVSAQLALEGQTNRTVLLCPSGYGLRQREALRLAGELAGMHVERVVSSSLAVAVEVTQGRSDSSMRLLIVDFGASHFDASVVQVGNGAYRVERTICRADLGGIEIDRAIADRLAKEVERAVKHPVDPRDVTWPRLLHAAENAKVALSSEDSTHVVIEHPLSSTNASFSLEIDFERTRAEELAAPFIVEAEAVCRTLLADAIHVDAVIGVGGQFSAPEVRRRLAAVFEGRLDVREEHTAVMGAARVANGIQEERPLMLYECLNVPMGVSGPDGSFAVLLDTQTTCPASVPYMYKFRGEPLVLYEGDEEIEPVAQIDFEAGVTDFDADVVFALDAAARLSVSAKEREFGISVDLAIARTGQPLPATPPKSKGLFGWIRSKLE
jgi:molecular chaperone DnaK